MRYKIKRKKHRAWPPVFGINIGTKKIVRKVKFDESCKYLLPDEDQEDVNKLFGIGYFWSHHKDSARFGWRYDMATKTVMLLAYCYVDGERITKEMIHVPFNTEIECTIYINEDHYKFVIGTSMLVYTDKVPFNHNKTVGYPLGLYFGGNQPAPHNIYVEISK